MLLIEGLTWFAGWMILRKKRVEKGFDDLFDEPFGEKRQDNRTQEQKDKEAVEQFKREFMSDGLEAVRRNKK